MLVGTARRPHPRLRAAVTLGDLAARLSRLTGRGAGGVIGGRVVLAMVPDALAELAAGRATVTVSGTNGKTTTAAFVAAALASRGPVLSNADGANTPPGLVRALAAGRPGDGRPGVLEVDEAWLPSSLPGLGRPTAVLTNLSRDQLHRHHETRRLAAAWRGAMRDAGHVVANADDPAVVFAALAAPRRTWVAAGGGWTGDRALCPACGDRLEVDDGDHSTLSGADWWCACGLRRPDPSWWVEDVGRPGDDAGRLVGPTGPVPLRLSLPGRVNRRDAALAVAAVATLGVDPGCAAERLTAVGSVAGRYQVVEHDGHAARLMLAKNPASWAEVLDLIGPGATTPVVLAFNCDGVDGRDSSWLYDVDFTRLATHPVVVTGRRATDLVARLEIDEVPDVRRAADVRNALRLLPPGPVDVVGTYTAFQEARHELARAG